MRLLTLACLLVSIVAIAAPAAKAPQKKKGRVVDLGTLDVEGEARQPNLQLIEGPAIRDKILKKVFTDSLRRVEAELLQPATAADFPELKTRGKEP